MSEQASDAFVGADTVFCTLGTTRKVCAMKTGGSAGEIISLHACVLHAFHGPSHVQDAGSAEGFKKIDFEWVEAAAKIAKKAGCRHFSLLTAAGSNAGMSFCELMKS